MIKKIIIGISILLASVVGIYQFMTASRPFDLGIEINQKMNEIAKENNLTVFSSLPFRTPHSRNRNSPAA